ncbi:F-box domain-containing protein [Mycena chlorophos]|uniref:F-box domain-containing protein n=1 Tax=Mycena chlorophos TaxID=658473 RepID=A0A8H6S819_MYCCL|nr:F-box domain-containing protein [Mycena chlorophos]
MEPFYAARAEADSPGFYSEATSLLADAHSELARLEARVIAQRRRIAGLSYALTPLHKVPVELLVDIFLRVVDSVDDIRAAIVLSAVCAYWREMALQTPRIWTKGLKIDAVAASDETVAVFTKLLHRSAPHPVDIELHHKDGGTLRKDILGVVAKISPRWGRFTASFDFFRSVRPLHDSGSGEGSDSAPIDGGWESVSLALPSLTYICVQCETLSNPIVLSAPRLTEADIAVHKYINLRDFLPWSQLTSLVLLNENTRGFCAILDRCTALTSLRLDVVAWRTTRLPQFAGRVTLPCLRLLEVSPVHRSSDEYTFEPFFEHYTCPALEDLQLAMEIEYNTNVEADFVAFLRRSPVLQRLRIHHCDMGPDILGDILRNIPAVTTLELYYSRDCVTEAFFEALTYHPQEQAATTPAQAPLMPRLHTLILEGTCGQYTVEALQGMIRSRWWVDDSEARDSPVARLKHVNVEYSVSLFGEDEHFEELEKKLRKEGLDVSISYG